MICEYCAIVSSLSSCRHMSNLSQSPRIGSYKILIRSARIRQNPSINTDRTSNRLQNVGQSIHPITQRKDRWKTECCEMFMWDYHEPPVRSGCRDVVTRKPCIETEWLPEKHWFCHKTLSNTYVRLINLPHFAAEFFIFVPNFIVFLINIIFGASHVVILFKMSLLLQLCSIYKNLFLKVLESDEVNNNSS